MKPNQTLCFAEVHRFLTGLFDGDMHAKRVLSPANATLGVIKTASLAVNTIGQGLALARGRMTKHAIKQSLPPRRRYLMHTCHVGYASSPKKPLARRGASTVRFVAATGEQEP